jgi:hypothetical protein
LIPIVIVKAYTIILFLLYSSFIAAEDDVYNVVFDDDVIIKNNLIVNTINVPQAVTITGNILKVTGNVTISGNGNITLTASPGIYFNNLENKELVYYLVLDKNNILGYTPQSPENLPIQNLNTNTIESEPQNNLVIGKDDNDQVTINSQTVEFSQNLNCDTISFNQPVEINSEIHFLNETTVNQDLTVTGGNLILENKSDNNITINCNQFNSSIPINTYGSTTIGNPDLSSIITLNNLVGNITIGSKENPITSFGKLETSENPAYYLVADNSGIVKQYDATKPYIITQDSYTNDTISVNNIESANQINFNTDILSITTDNIAFQYSRQNIRTDLIINDQECTAERYLAPSGCNINTAEIQPNLSFEIENLYFFSKKLSQLSICTLSFSHYYLKNIPVIIPLDAIPLTIELPTGQLTFKKTNNTVKYKNTEKTLNPITFFYKDSYKIKNNDMCYKNNSKIEHFGFIAEDMEHFGIENLVIRDNQNKIIDYNNQVLMKIIEEKIMRSQQYYEKIFEKYNLFKKNVENIRHENTIRKNIINQKKKLIILLQNIINNNESKK